VDSGSARDLAAPAADTAPPGPDAGSDLTDSAGAADGAAPGGPLTGTVPIMVLGSSNETGTCWRAFLWQKLRAAGVMNFDFVGRTSTGPDCGVAGYDKDVEAAPGTIITGFSANDFAVRFKAHPPRIVLVHVGGADARNGVPIPRILAAFTLAVEQARAVEPHVIFFVAQHTPQQPMTGINELNAALPGWAMQLGTPESPVAVVDLFTGIVPATDQSDGTHLNDAGSQKVAQWFLAVLLPLFKP
jgi:lysophospholipase L1-like esterase